jgi:hypothetical protein
MLAVMLLGDRRRQSAHFESDDLETFALDTPENFTDQAAGYAIGLDQDEGALRHGFNSLYI